VGNYFSNIKTHIISPISRHSVRNITFYFLSSDSVVRNTNLFSVSCAPVYNDVAERLWWKVLKFVEVLQINRGDEEKGCCVICDRDFCLGLDS